MKNKRRKFIAILPLTLKYSLHIQEVKKGYLKKLLKNLRKISNIKTRTAKILRKKIDKIISITDIFRCLTFLVFVNEQMTKYVTIYFQNRGFSVYWRSFPVILQFGTI